MTTQQWLALVIFILSYGLIISQKVSRTTASIFGAVLSFFFILGPKELLHYEN
jgi:Na+/H+ antiporter NhaD/arsenite permease-like protein